MIKYIFRITSLVVLGTFQQAECQVKLLANFEFGIMDVANPYEQFLTGYQAQGGIIVEGDIPFVTDLSWESGLDLWYGSAQFYDLKRGNHEVVNDNFPLDKSEKLSQNMWSVEIPARVRYNAFGFMGIMAGVDLAIWSDRYTYRPTVDMKVNKFYYKPLHIALESGLYFPISENIRIELKVKKSIGGRFYLSEIKNELGEISYGGAYSDFGVLLGFGYQLNH